VGKDITFSRQRFRLIRSSRPGENVFPLGYHSGLTIFLTLWSKTAMRAWLIAAAAAIAIQRCFF
jgi:hypothetical protein